MVLLQRIYSLKGVIQNYSWGGYNYIPDLLGIMNEQNKPHAEYWMGAHPNYSSELVNSSPSSLHNFISNDPSVLGKNVAEKFGSLPYLLKILDVRQMLSIQVHPSIDSAIIGFEEENKKTFLYMLHIATTRIKITSLSSWLPSAIFGCCMALKNETAIYKILSHVPELNFLTIIFQTKGYRGLYEEVMLMEQSKVNEILKPLLQRVTPLYNNNSLNKDGEDFWAAKAALNFCKDNNYDRGIFSIYLFNVLHLKIGEGIFQAAGLPHAYLEGQNVEVMANSDNVLRAGLTDKHIDVAELMKHVKFEDTNPNIISSSNNSHKIFNSPAEEFELHQYEIEKVESLQSNTAEILFVTEGNLCIQSGDEEILARKGEAFFILAETIITIKAMSPGNLFRVTVPQLEKSYK